MVYENALKIENFMFSQTCDAPLENVYIFTMRKRAAISPNFALWQRGQDSRPRLPPGYTNDHASCALLFDFQRHFITFQILHLKSGTYLMCFLLIHFAKIRTNNYGTCMLLNRVATFRSKQTLAPLMQQISLSELTNSKI